MNFLAIKTILIAAFTLPIVMIAYKCIGSLVSGQFGTTYLYAFLYYGILMLLAVKHSDQEMEYSVAESYQILKEKWYLLFFSFISFIAMILAVIGLKYYFDIIDIPIMYSQFPDLIDKRGLSQLIIIFFIAPLIEELFFRAFIFQNLKYADKPLVGALFSSLLFAIAPFSIWQAVGLFFFGLVQCYVYQESQGQILIPIINNIIFTTCIFILPII